MKSVVFGRLIEFGKAALVFSAFIPTLCWGQASLWSTNAEVAKDTSKQNEFYVGGVTSAFMGSGSIDPFDISSYQRTSGTRVENNANLEARLRSKGDKVEGSQLTTGFLLGYNLVYSEKISFLAELAVSSSKNAYSGAFYGGAQYKLYEAGKLKISAIGKLGFGQQVVYLNNLSHIADSIPVTAGRVGSSTGKVFNDYGSVVFTRQGLLLEDDRVMLSFLGVQYQAGLLFDYNILGDRLLLKGQLAYQGAYTWLDKIVIDPNKSYRTDNFRNVSENAYELQLDNEAIVKTDLGSTKSNLKSSTLFNGVFVSVGLGVKF
jgi:hypothetical protein